MHKNLILVKLSKKLILINLRKKLILVNDVHNLSENAQTSSKDIYCNAP